MTDAIPSFITFTPGSAFVGDTIVLSGCFDADKEKNIVWFGDLQAEVICNSNTQLEVIVPSGTVSGKISVAVNGYLIVSSATLTIHTIYIVGSMYRSNGSKYPSATCWKNGEPIFLTDGENFGVATSIAVAGDDVYVAGYNGHDIDIAKYWKNGIEVSLTNGENYANATGIAVTGNDVYVAGHDYDKNIGDVATYWKNGLMPIQLLPMEKIFTSPATK